jgi:hypothetical protein
MNKENTEERILEKISILEKKFSMSSTSLLGLFSLLLRRQIIVEKILLKHPLFEELTEEEEDSAFDYAASMIHQSVDIIQEFYEQKEQS